MSETVEISAQKLRDLQAAEAFLNDLGNDGEIGITVKQRAEKKFNVKHPDLVARQQIEDTLVKPLRAELEESKKNFKDVDERLTKFQNENLNAKEEVALEKKLRNAQSQYGLTDEGLNKAINRMKAEGHTDIDAAASWVVGQEPKAKPASAPNYMPQDFNLFGSSEIDEQWRGLNENPVKFADKEIANIMNDFASGEQDKYREFGGTL